MQNAVLKACLGFLPDALSSRVANRASHATLWAVLNFYKISHFLAAPNQSMVDMLAKRTNRPTFLMRHGVDTKLFTPGRRNCGDKHFTIGFVGRLSPEKNVRALVELARALLAGGESRFRFTVIGEGSERAWLQDHLRNAEFPGILKGMDLATAFANMDTFVFPSVTDTFGLVILEAMSSGVPVIVSPETGARAGVQDGVDGFCTHDFAASVRSLMHSPETRAIMGGAARAHACAAAWPGVFDDVYRIYREGLASEQTRRRMPTPKFGRPSLASPWR